MMYLQKYKKHVGWDRESLKGAQLKSFKEKEYVTDPPKELLKPVIWWFQGVLCRFSRAKGAPADVHVVHKQIVVPEEYRSKLMWLAHENHLAEHFGVRKKVKRLADNFYWPLMKKDVKWYVSSL